MASFGDNLRQERERRGISLSEVASATNVGLHLLEALEANDFKRLPGGPFNKGFVRAYARHLGLDADALISAYAREERSQGLNTPDVGKDVASQEGRAVEWRQEGERTTLVLDWVLLRNALGVLAAVTFLVLLAWMVWPQDSRQPAAVQAMARMEESPPAEQPRSPDDRTSPLPPPGVETTAGTRDETVSSPAADEPAPATPAPVLTSAPATAPQLTMSDFGVGTGVRDRMLVGRNDAFPVTAQVWFWTRTLGGTPGTTIHHVWLHEGRPIVSYARTLGGPHWRNSSRKTLRPGDTGTWTVEARDDAGLVLARARFVALPD